MIFVFCIVLQVYKGFFFIFWVNLQFFWDENIANTATIF